jgi:hypothetical protein
MQLRERNISRAWVLHLYEHAEQREEEALLPLCQVLSYTILEPVSGDMSKVQTV